MTPEQFNEFMIDKLHKLTWALSLNEPVEALDALAQQCSTDISNQSLTSDQIRTLGALWSSASAVSERIAPPAPTNHDAFLDEQIHHLETLTNILRRQEPTADVARYAKLWVDYQQQMASDRKGPHSDREFHFKFTLQGVFIALTGRR